jgi:hypothetical protein
MIIHREKKKKKINTNIYHAELDSASAKASELKFKPCNLDFSFVHGNFKPCSLSFNS